MRKVLLMIALVACGGDDGDTNDAGPGSDGGRPVLTLDCPTYCTTIMANCTGANAQYQDMNECLGTCSGFPPGAAATETSGNTLGCRIYHAQNAMVLNDAVTHCPHAGPPGGKVDSTGTCGDPCVSFCALEEKICGTDAAPVTGVTNRYTSTAACMTACAGFNKTVQYSPTAPNGDTFACRVNHVTNAGTYKQMNDPGMQNTHCGHTLSPATGVCRAP
jgi:hypothetical protein